MGISKFHFRSISLPSRLHPINPTKTKAELQNLRSPEVLGIIPVTSESIQSGLVRLAQMYNSVEVTRHFSATQQWQLITDQHGKSMQESSTLEGSIELLDLCNIIRELVQMIKENVQALQLALRRKGLDSSIQNDLIKYACFRKNMNKIVAKSIKKIKSFENKNGLSNPSTNVNQSFTSVVNEAIYFTIVIFKGILGFLSSPTANPRGWNLVSKLMIPKPVDFCADDSVNSEVAGSVDFALKTLQEMIRGNGAKISDIKMFQKSLMNLDVCIEELEGGLGRLFRQLLVFRVKLLNILTDH